LISKCPNFHCNWIFYILLPGTRGSLHSGPLDFAHPVHPIATPLPTLQTSGSVQNKRCRLKGGRYQNLEAGFGNTALLHFTGGVSFGIVTSSMDASAIFSKVDYCLHKDDGLVTCITNVSQTTSQRQNEFMYASAYKV